MTYFEKLQTDEWRLKRETILTRDKSTCQRCGFKHNTVDKLAEEFTFKELNDVHGIMFTLPYEINNISTIDLFIRRSKLKCKVIQDKTPQDFQCRLEDYVLLMFGQYNPSGNDEMLYDLKGLQKFPKTIWNPSLDHDIQYIFHRYDRFINFEFAYSVPITKIKEFEKNCLHIHHKCYRKGFEPWEQDNFDYVTLCNICHKNVHESVTIPYYNGQIILQSQRSCQRCNGRRIFECYKHVQNGVCFRCNGSGTEPEMK